MALNDVTDAEVGRAARDPGKGTSADARTRSAWVAADLRRRIAAYEWQPGERLPGEHQLAEHYGMSRTTVRTALRDMESRGLTLTIHGRGTLVAVNSPGHSDLRRLESITDTIANQGRVPSVTYRSIEIRTATETEAALLRLADDAEVLATSRSLHADGETVAFSYDTMPLELLGPTFDTTEVTGSLFALLEQHGIYAVVAATEIHSAQGPGVGWGDHGENPTYLLLEQTHTDRDGRGVAYARTYFIEGRFQFSLLRHR